MKGPGTPTPWAPLAAALLLGGACREPPPASASAESPGVARLRAASCAGLLPATKALDLLGHAATFGERRQDEGRFQALSCAHGAPTSTELFAFDVGCGSGAKERFRTLVRATADALRQSEPVGTEAWAADAVYLSWHAQVGCYTTVLLSPRRPGRVTLLPALAAALAASVARPPSGPSPAPR